MPGGAGLIIGTGAELIAVATIGNLPKIAGLTPQTLNDSILNQRVDGLVNYITIGNSYTTALGYAETFRTKGGFISEGLAPDTLVLGRGAYSGTLANGLRNTVIGTTATTGNTAVNNVVIGYGANAAGQSDCVIVGNSASVNLCGGVVIGSGAYGGGNAGGSNVVAIGQSAVGWCNGGGNSLAVGNLASARDGDTLIGWNTKSVAGFGATSGNTVVGSGAHAIVAAAATTVMGFGSFCDFVNGTVIGGQSSSLTPLAVIVGHGSTTSVTGTKAIVIGQAATSTHDQAIVIGHGAASIGANTMTVGGTNLDVRTVVIGKGNTTVSPAARMVRWTNASGLDNIAGNVTWQAPLSTGAAAPANHVFTVGVAHGSDAVLQTADIAMQLDGSVAAGDTRMLLYTADTGTVQRVKTITNAAIDTLTGIAGSRLLYVPV